LLKYYYSNFSLEILEYCDLVDVIKREQYYMDLLKPAYNIELTAGSRLGSFHDEETKAKMRAAHIGREQPNFWQSTPPSLSSLKAGEIPPSRPRFLSLFPLYFFFGNFLLPHTCAKAPNIVEGQ
jgi:hypothetical protein